MLFLQDLEFDFQYYYFVYLYSVPVKHGKPPRYFQGLPRTAKKFRTFKDVATLNTSATESVDESTFNVEKILDTFTNHFHSFQ